MGLTNSRIVSRTAPMKGVKAVSFGNFLASTPVVNTATGVIALPDNISAIQRVNVKATGNNSLDPGVFDPETRTSEYAAVLSFFIPGNDDTLRKEIQTFSGFLQTIFIEDYNGKIYVLGSKNGCELVSYGFSSDKQGWDIVINSKEAEAMYVLAAAGVTAYLAALTAVA